MCYNKSMKRINILKGIEQILVQKAYETGHISHRADGDWQKQADGSWKPYAGQSTSQTQEPAPTENTEYGEITEEDLEPSYGDDEVDYTYAEDIDYSQYDDDIKSIEFRENNDGEFEPHDDDYIRVADKIYEQTNREDMSDEEADQLYDEIVDRVIDRAHELRNSWIGSEDSNDWEEEDTEGYYGNSGGLRSTIYEGAYDTQISNIGNTEEDDYGNSVPNDEAVENVVRGIMQEWTGDTDNEDAVEAVHDGLKDAVLDRWSSIYVQKSAIRDMRSTPTTKNMGF